MAQTVPYYLSILFTKDILLMKEDCIVQSKVLNYEYFQNILDGNEMVFWMMFPNVSKKITSGNTEMIFILAKKDKITGSTFLSAT